MARKRKSKPTGKRRAEKQQVKDRLAHAQDDAQRLGIIPTLPEEALGSARVDPNTQGEQPLHGLVVRAARNGWATPDERKPRLVDEMIDIVEGAEVDEHIKVSAFRALQQADQAQWERDHPDEAARAKGGVKVGVNVQNNNQVGLITQEQLVGLLLQPEGGEEHPIERRLLELEQQPQQSGPPPPNPDPPGPS